MNPEIIWAVGIMTGAAIGHIWTLALVVKDRTGETERYLCRQPTAAELENKR